MKYISVCSGIEAATVAWSPLGFDALAFSEIDKFPSAVLAHHYPDVPNLGDMTKFKEWPDYEPDILVGGTPCQSFSVAGLRKGLADPRGNLMLTYLAIAERYQPEWIVWENVPGVLSSGSGRDFGAFLGALGEIGYGWAYRILDAQFFGVPQRRRRVFVVGHLGDWRRAAAVLFERHSLQGHTPPSRAAMENIAPTISARTKGGGGLGTDFDLDGGLIQQEQPVASFWNGEQVSQTLDAVLAKGQMMPEKNRFPAVLVPISIRTSHTKSNGLGVNTEGTSYTLEQSNGQAIAFNPVQGGMGLSAIAPPIGSSTGGGNQGAVAFAQNTRDEVREMSVVGSLASQPGMKQTSYIRNSMQVRRLTPKECCRLQGFPDAYLDIIYRGKPAADGPRYKALGNSMAVPVMRWIGERIQLVQNLTVLQDAGYKTEVMVCQS